MLLLHGLRCLTGLVNSGDSIWGLEGLGRKGDTCGSGVKVGPLPPSESIFEPGKSATHVHE